MIFLENRNIEKVGEKIGFLLAYFIFTTILFLILSLTHKVATLWKTYFEVALITIGIVLIGFGLERVLK